LRLSKISKFSQILRIYFILLHKGTARMTSFPEGGGGQRP